MKFQQKARKMFPFLLGSNLLFLKVLKSLKGLKTFERFKSPFLFVGFFGFLFFFSSSYFVSFAFCADKNDEAVKFLMDIKTLKADFIQEQQNGEQIEKAKGSIFVKKPSSVMLRHDGGGLKLKIVSINGNVKVFDENIGQTTYIDNSYSDLVQFFTDNLKPEKIVKNGADKLCLPFESFGNEQIACLKIDLQKNTISNISVYLLPELQKGEKRKGYVFDQKIMDIVFQNVEINKGVDSDIFTIKDNRIFDDED